MYAAMDNHLARRNWVMGDEFTWPIARCCHRSATAACASVRPRDRRVRRARGAERPSMRRQAELAPHLARAAS
jgi:hypothetical protein